MITREIQKEKDIIRALTNPVNLSIVLIVKEKGELNTRQIYTQLVKKQNVVSNKLNWLTYLGILTRRDQGQVAHYKLIQESVLVRNLLDSISQQVFISNEQNDWFADEKRQQYTSLLSDVRRNLIRQFY